MSRSPVLAYIAGRGYSGSTLLDLLIGSHSQAVSLGELRALSEETRAKGRRFAEDRCTCGAPSLYECPFWSRVSRRLQGTTGRTLGTVDVYAADHNRALLDAIREQSGAPVLVDSSKQPARLRQLLDDASIDVRPIHLTREPLAEVWSHIKRGESLREKVRMYNRDTVTIDRMLRDRDHLVVRYERLANAPRDELTRIMRWLGLPLEEAQLAWTDHEHHNISGNPMRFSGSHDIRLDRSWRDGLSVPQKVLIALTSLPGRYPRSPLFETWPTRWK